MEQYNNGQSKIGCINKNKLDVEKSYLSYYNDKKVQSKGGKWYGNNNR